MYPRKLCQTILNNFSSNDVINKSEYGQREGVTAGRALAVGGFKSKKDTVNQALREFVQRRKQREIFELFGNFPADDDYDYKKGRK